MASSPRHRSITVVLLGAALVVTLAGCGAGGDDQAGGPGAATATQVEGSLAAAGAAADPGSVTCPEAVATGTGDTVTCSFTSEGQPVTVEARTVSSNGDKAQVELATRAEPIPRAVLADAVGNRVSQAIGTPLTSTVCAGDLPAEAGASTTCDLAAGSEQRTVTITVTAIEGGRIEYSLT